MTQPTPERVSQRANTLLPDADPMHDALAAAVMVETGDIGARVRLMESYLRFLRHEGVTLADAKPELTDRWLGTRSGAARANRLAPLRATMRTLVEAGAMQTDPTATLPTRGPRRGDRSLTEGEFERVLAPIRAEAQRGNLVASRDMVLLALAAWRPMSPTDVSALRWADVVPLADCSCALSGLPDVVMSRIEHLRHLLKTRGVEVVTDDALVMALGNRIYYDWTSPERALLAPLAASAVYKAVERRVVRAGVDRCWTPGHPHLSLRAFHRQPSQLEEALVGRPSPRRVAMRSPASRDPIARCGARWADVLTRQADRTIRCPSSW